MRQGFSIIESIVYIAILGIMAGVFVSFALNIQSLGSKTYSVSEVGYQGRFAMDTISRLLREAESVVAPTKGNTATSLELDMPGTPDNTVINLNSGVLQMTEGAGSPESLTTDTVTFDSLVFINTSQGRARDSIRASFTISFSNADSIEFEYSKTFTSTIKIRKP